CGHRGYGAPIMRQRQEYRCSVFLRSHHIPGVVRAPGLWCAHHAPTTGMSSFRFPAAPSAFAKTFPGTIPPAPLSVSPLWASLPSPPTTRLGAADGGSAPGNQSASLFPHGSTDLSAVVKERLSRPSTYRPSSKSASRVVAAWRA